jgi:hypothetical protein
VLLEDTGLHPTNVIREVTIHQEEEEEEDSIQDIHRLNLQVLSLTSYLRSVRLRVRVRRTQLERESVTGTGTTRGVTKELSMTIGRNTSTMVDSRQSSALDRQKVQKVVVQKVPVSFLCVTLPPFRYSQIQKGRKRKTNLTFSFTCFLQSVHPILTLNKDTRHSSETLVNRTMLQNPNRLNLVMNTLPSETLSTEGWLSRMEERNKEEAEDLQYLRNRLWTID